MIGQYGEAVIDGTKVLPYGKEMFVSPDSQTETYAALKVRSWKYREPVVKIAKNKKKEFPNYRAGSLGPEEAERLIKQDGRQWCLPKTIEKERG